jgi:hypothetical protein
MSIVDLAAEYLRANGFPDASKRRLDGLTGAEGVVVRFMIDTPVVAYMDGSAICQTVYQVVCRNRSEAAAMENCAKAAALLDGVDLGGLVSHTVYSEPQELGLEERGFHAWECRMAAQVYKEP